MTKYLRDIRVFLRFIGGGEVSKTMVLDWKDKLILRHLFARTYYSIEKDLSRLADLLGHSSITTTRIYMMETGKEHLRKLERMGLVLAKK